MGGRLLAAAATALACAGPAAASQLIDRSATNVRLGVNGKGEALVTYVADGRQRRVLAWGAVNALPPTASRAQVQFRLDYAGGWGRYRTNYWKTFRDTCGPYRGPNLAWFVTGCTAADGSHWALQSFPQPLPNLGFTPWLPSQRATWLELSHWSGPLAKLQVWSDWVYRGRFQQLFGRLTYRGRAVHGFGTTRYGAPTDHYGRLLYLDTYDSGYGSGWRRENSFVAHKPTGIFCYGFYPFDATRGGYVYPPDYDGEPRGPGTGTAYRLTAQGPGVTPDVVWYGPGLHEFIPGDPRDEALQREMSGVLQQIIGPDRICSHGR